MTDAQNALLGVAAGAIEAASTQPLTYTKNCIQQKVRVSLDPRIMYRGTPASMLADGTLIGAQFWVCGFLQKLIVKGNPRDLTFAEEVGSAYLAGFASGVPCTVLELTMIQQQRFGGTLPGTLRRLYERNGLSGLFRGFVPASQREAFFAVGYLGLSPRVERVCDSLEMSPTARVRGSPLDGASMAWRSRRDDSWTKRLTVSTPRRRRSCGSAWRSSPTGSSTSHGGTLNKFTQKGSYEASASFLDSCFAL